MVNNIKNDVLTADKAANFLQIGLKTIYILLSEERMPGKIFGKKVGREWRIKREEIDKFLSEEKVSSSQMSINQIEEVKKNK